MHGHQTSLQRKLTEQSQTLVRYLANCFEWLQFGNDRCDSRVSVGVMTIPQSLGYSILASLPPITGLYTSIFPAFVYMFFTTSRHVSLGTMALSSLVIAEAVKIGTEKFILRSEVSSTLPLLENTTLFDSLSELSPSSGSLEDLLTEEKVRIACSISFLAGLMLVVMSVLRLGFFVSFMSEAFISGYLGSSTLRIITLQIRLILGVRKIKRSGVRVGEYFYLVYDICRHIGDTNLVQVVMSVIAIVSLVLVKTCINDRFKSRLKAPVPIDLLVIAVATVVSYFCDFKNQFRVEILEFIPQGIPAPVLPSVDHMVSNVFSAFMLAIISYMLVAIMAKLFAGRHHYSVNNNQELLATGLASMGGSLFGCMAASTSPPRCFLMEGTGGRTQLTHLVSAVVVLLTVLFVAPLFNSLPTCVLACIILVACIPLFADFRAWITYYKTDRYDLSVWLVTACSNLLLAVDLGLVVGIAYSLLIVHVRMQNARTSNLARDDRLATNDDDNDFVFLDSRMYSGVVTEKKPCTIFRFESPLYFATLDVFKSRLWASVDHFLTTKTVVGDDGGSLEEVVVLSSDLGEPCVDKNQIKIEAVNGKENLTDLLVTFVEPRSQTDVSVKSTSKEDELHLMTENGTNNNWSLPCVVVDCTSISFVDTGGAKLLGQLHSEYAKTGVRFLLAGCSVDVLARLKNVVQCSALVATAIFPSVQDAIVWIERRDRTAL